MQKKLILVGWDGADWNLAQPLMDRGRMPQLSHMVENGVSGILRSSPPYLSPMLWTTIATGKSPAEHGIIGFREFNETSQSLQPISSKSRQCKAIWNILSQEGWKTNVLGWFATYPAESINGVMVSDLFASLGTRDPEQKTTKRYVSPEDKMKEILPLSISADAIDPGLLQYFIPRLNEINLKKDKRPLELMKRLAELYSYHNTAIALLKKDEVEFMTIYYHFLDWICHDFMALAPPQRPEVSERDYALYSEVVSRAYELQDLLLRDLLQHAGKDVNCLVISDHGFLSGNERPLQTPKVDAGIAAWHRIEGMIVGAGPLFNSGVNDIKATHFDIVPTLLHMLELPVGADMPGQVLSSMLKSNNYLEKIDSWEKRGNSLENETSESVDPDVTKALLKQFEELGYVSPHEERKELAESKSRRENAWNLGVALMGESRLEDALPYLEEAYFYHPEASHKALPLVRCQIQLGLIEESLVTEQSLLDYGPQNGELCYHLAIIYRMRKDYEVALSYIDQATKYEYDKRLISLEHGLILLHTGQFEEAEQIFRTQTVENPSISAELGLCRALVLSDKSQEAEQRTSAIVKAFPDVAMAWFTLGQSLERLERLDEAKEAFDHAIQSKPEFPEAKAKKFRLHRDKIEASEQFAPLFYHDMNFSELPEEKASKEHTIKLSRLREDSKKRRQIWKREQNYYRSADYPVKVFNSNNQQADKQKPVVIVSGLPRSGTSMMMEMLQKGGMTLQVDDKRPADTNSPRGFFEWEPIKSLGDNPNCISQAVGKVVKVVSSQLQFLPRNYVYFIIWMNRPISEVARSQQTMLQEQGNSHNDLTDSKILLQNHQNEILQSVRKYADNPKLPLRLTEINYADCINYADDVCSNLASFLGELLPAPEKMNMVIDPALYRNREKENKTNGRQINK